MVKKIISVATAFLMLCCMIPFAAFADDVLEDCPKCGEHTYTKLQDFSMSTSDFSFPIAIKKRYCSSCNYTYYEWNCLGITGYKEFDNGGYSVIVDYLNQWANRTFGKNATAEKIDATNGGANIPAAGGRNPKGYGDEGKANVNSSGSQIIWVEPFGISNERSGFYKVAPTNCVTGSSSTGVSFPWDYRYNPTYYFVAPVTGLYYVGSFGSPYDFGTFSSFDASKWSLFYMTRTFSNTYQYSVSLSKGDACYFSYEYYNGRLYLKGKPYKFYLNNIPIFVEPLGDSSITTVNNITITNNNYSQTWNGNIYTDNSTNLTYIYPQYTTINESGDTVTNISTTPIIYNNETKQYYTYDQTTKNYYYIYYGSDSPTPTPSPEPSPTPTPDPSQPTPTPTPGGDTGDTTGILAVLVEIRDNMIQGFLDIKAALVQGWADLSANFTLAIENLTINIQNFFSKGMSGAPVDPNIPGGGSGTISTPETGGKDDSGGSGWSWNPLKWLSDLLKDIVEGIIKAIWKLITALFGFLLWLLSLVGSLFPFIPGQAVLAVTSAVVIVAVIRIIKFITGR